MPAVPRIWRVRRVDRNACLQFFVKRRRTPPSNPVFPHYLVRGALMRETSETFLTCELGRQARRWMAPALMAASVAVPGVTGLLAKDKPANEAVAKKIDETTRLGSEKGDKH